MQCFSNQNWKRNTQQILCLTFVMARPERNTGRYHSPVERALAQESGGVSSGSDHDPGRSPLVSLHF